MSGWIKGERMARQRHRLSRSSMVPWRGESLSHNLIWETCRKNQPSLHYEGPTNEPLPFPFQPKKHWVSKDTITNDPYLHKTRWRRIRSYLSTFFILRITVFSGLGWLRRSDKDLPTLINRVKWHQKRNLCQFYTDVNVPRRFTRKIGEQCSHLWVHISIKERDKPLSLSRVQCAMSERDWDFVHLTSLRMNRKWTLGSSRSWIHDPWAVSLQLWRQKHALLYSLHERCVVCTYVRPRHQVSSCNQCTLLQSAVLTKEGGGIEALGVIRKVKYNRNQNVKSVMAKVGDWFYSRAPNDYNRDGVRTYAYTRDFGR